MPYSYFAVENSDQLSGEGGFDFSVKEHGAEDKI